MENKIAITLMIGMFILLFSMSGINAEQQSLGTKQQGECIELIQTCGNCSYINITSVRYPNSTSAIQNVEMNQSGTEYTYEFCNTSELGTYIVNLVGDPDGEKTPVGYDFEITPTGQNFTTGKSLGGIGIIGISIALSFLFVFVGYKFADSPNKNLMPLGFFFVIFGFIMAIFALHLGYAFSSDIMQYESLAPVTSAIYISFLWSFIGIAIISSALMLISFIRELGNVIKKKKFGEDFNPIEGVYQ